MMPVSDDWLRYREFWLIIACVAGIWAVIVVVELGMIAYKLWR